MDVAIPSYQQKSEQLTKQHGLDSQDSTTSTPLFILNNGFFPDIDVHDFDRRYQTDSTYGQARRQDRLQAAMLEANAELQDQACQWVRQGYYTLAEVPQAEYGEANEWVLAYQKAVYAKAMELMSERYRATDTRRYADPKSETMRLIAQEWENEYRRWIYHLLEDRQGSSSYVELL